MADLLRGSSEAMLMAKSVPRPVYHVAYRRALMYGNTHSSYTSWLGLGQSSPSYALPVFS